MRGEPLGRIVGWSESIEIRFASMLRRVNDWVSTNQRSLFRLLPVLIGLSSLVWLVPLTYFLFGTDSFHFVNPFDFNFNPLYQYSYLYSPTYPIPDSTPLFYLEGLLTILQGAGSPPWLTERIVIVSIAIIGAYGFFRLCGTWNVINDRPRYTGALRAALATTFYILNPLTLTVVWWHFGNYTIFYAFAPFLVSAFFSLTYRKTPNIPEICGTIALGIILAPGVSGAYASRCCTFGTDLRDRSDSGSSSEQEGCHRPRDPGFPHSQYRTCPHWLDYHSVHPNAESRIRVQ